MSEIVNRIAGVQKALTLLLLFLYITSTAQENVVVHFIDAARNTAIGNVTVLDRNGSWVATSDTGGYVVIPVSHFNASGYLLAFHTGYSPDTLYPGSTIVYLAPLSSTLRETIVNANKISKLLRAPVEYVVDYDFVGDQVIVATYSGNNGGNAKLFLLNGRGDALAISKLPYEPVSLFKSCIGKYYCVCGQQFYPLDLGPNSIYLRPAYNISLLPGLQQCEHSIQGNRFYRFGNNLTFSMEYGVIRKDDTLFTPFLRFAEDKVARASLEEYFEILDLLEHYHFKEAAHKQRLRTQWDRSSYAHIDLPSFVCSDTVVIFDFFKKSLRYFSPSGDSLGCNPIRFPWRESQRFEILKDEARNKFYVHRYDSHDAQTIEELYINKGITSGIRTSVGKPFAEDVKVYDGTIYFLWQDGAAGATRQLYTQKME